MEEGERKKPEKAASMKNMKWIREWGWNASEKARVLKNWGKMKIELWIGLGSERNWIEVKLNSLGSLAGFYLCIHGASCVCFFCFFVDFLVSSRVLALSLCVPIRRRSAWFLYLSFQLFPTPHDIAFGSPSLPPFCGIWIFSFPNCLLLPPSPNLGC
jgi:hypothetical protein